MHGMADLAPGWGDAGLLIWRSVILFFIDAGIAPFAARAPLKNPSVRSTAEGFCFSQIAPSYNSNHRTADASFENGDIDVPVVDRAEMSPTDIGKHPPAADDAFHPFRRQGRFPAFKI